MKSFKTLSSTLVCSAFLAMSAGAQAITLFPNTLLEDDDYEYQSGDTGTTAIDGAFDPTLAGNGRLDIGDVLTGIFDITKIVNIDSPSTNFDPSELTGTFSTIVIDKQATLDPDLFNYTFGAVGADGVILKFYADPANDFAYGPTGCVDIPTCTATAEAGPLWATFGFTGDPDEQWEAFNAPDDLSVFSGFPPSVSVGNFRFALGVIDNFTGYKFADQTLNCILFTCANGDDDKVTLIGSGSVLGIQGLDTPFQVSSDTDFQLKTIPEPSLIGLLGMGFLGLIPSLRKRVK